MSGLYNPAYEHDGCGVACVARLGGQPEHEVVRRALTALENLEHRGAEGADPDTGDGAGILLQIPDRFLREVVEFELPEPGRYGVAVCFLPRRDAAQAAALRELIESTVAAEGQRVLGWREVPVDSEHCGRSSWEEAPAIAQLFVAAADEPPDQDAFERALYVIRRQVENVANGVLAIPSFSSRTLVYKGMLTAPQLPNFYVDLLDERVETALALVHSRFSTNTFPAWKLAHPYRMIAHNGEINTLRGNVNWMRAREAQLASHLFGEDLAKVTPVIQAGVSDSASLDNVLELLVLAGRSLPHALMMLVPEAWEQNPDVPEQVRAFYAYHSLLMEPWDGPASVTFTDGRTIGATLDRNGLRPGRWALSDDGYVVLASEAGSLPIPPERIVKLGRLRPGELFLVDIEGGRLVPSEEAKLEVASERPYASWYEQGTLRLADLPEPAPEPELEHPVRTLQRAFGYSQEDLRVLIAQMARSGQEPIGSMGNDLALAVLSDRQPPLFSYFKQLFAQVTNPAIDPIRESIVMSLETSLGAEGNLLEEGPEHARRLLLERPVLTDAELARVRAVEAPGLSAATLDITWPTGEGADGMEAALERLCREADQAIAAGATILIATDRAAGPDRVPIPSLLATAALHHHMVREGNRQRASLVVCSGEPREIHHVAMLIGYGAQAVNPYLMIASLHELDGRSHLPADVALAEAERCLLKALDKGLLKVLSKMGISTVRSYCGAQIFEAVGLGPEFIERYFTGTASQIGGVGAEVIAREALTRHARAWPANGRGTLPVGGIYAWRLEGERHMWDPQTVAKLRQLGQDGDPVTYEEFSHQVNEENAAQGMLRGLLDFRDEGSPVPLEEVEPATEIVKRFATGGMSLGALSPEAHETLAIAMNRIGAMSNTGEGGEDRRRYTPDPNGDLRRSSIKQVASGRFGVTIDYLVNADELQIKVAQGAKPGEGGQLPGEKVDEYIAQLRHSTPGVGLISPPPHHDIYSIEDLKQLIYDLRCANPEARVSVKLVSEVGCGTVAAGVAKANADHVVIAGHDGGTGASPLSSIQHAGTPWEIGLAETQQTLLLNRLRSRIVVQTDGQMRTGRDVVIAGLLGADEMAFSTAPLIAMGCIMMRVCHLNTCPVGVATQDPRLRERFEGAPENVVNYLILVAEEARRIMAGLGVRRFDDLIGRVEHLRPERAIEHWKARGLDLSDLLAPPAVPADAPRRRIEPPPPVLDDHLDHELIERCRPAIERAEPVRIETPIRNVNRTVGGMLSSAIAKRHGPDGLPEGAIEIELTGSAGQSFGAWLAHGVRLTLYGDANDYAGKGLSGGELAIRPPREARFVAEENVIVGNTVLYGATSGRAFFRGIAGERFCVRNSGVHAVVEGVGDHGCEYMTGGRVAVLGPTGRNFAAGMSGGVAWVLDPEGRFAERCNMELVDLEEVAGEDASDLRELISAHAERTGSVVAQRILDEWEATLPHFVQVMPLDYKRVTRELELVAVAATG